MLIFKRIIFVLICILDCYLLYSTIGYLILGIQTPKILGGVPTTFMGMYMMSMTFFGLFAVLTTIIVFLWIRFRRNSNQK
jgi:hypothetical protein